MTALLDVSGLSIRYGAVEALRHFSLAVHPGGLTAVLGANGAGKSSLLRALIGAQQPVAGRIVFDGHDIGALPPSERVRRGIAIVPEGRQILIGMTVHENLLMGAWCRGSSPSAAELDAIYDRFPNLAKRRGMSAGVLSGGEQQMLAISRALMSRPKLLLLDEPSLGLSPLLVNEVFALIRDLHRGGMAVVLVEQHVHKALKLAQQAIVLELGRTVACGTPEELLASEALREAYLGAH